MVIAARFGRDAATRFLRIRDFALAVAATHLREIDEGEYVESHNNSDASRDHFRIGLPYSPSTTVSTPEGASRAATVRRAASSAWMRGDGGASCAK
jgi:hypothetical protein